MLKVTIRGVLEEIKDFVQEGECVARYLHRDVEFSGSSTCSWKLDPADRLLVPAFSEKNNKYLENEFNQCQHYTAMWKSHLLHP